MPVFSRFSTSDSPRWRWVALGFVALLGLTQSAIRQAGAISFPVYVRSSEFGYAAPVLEGCLLRFRLLGWAEWPENRSCSPTHPVQAPNLPRRRAGIRAEDGSGSRW